MGPNLGPQFCKPSSNWAAFQHPVFPFFFFLFKNLDVTKELLQYREASSFHARVSTSSLKCTLFGRDRASSNAVRHICQVQGSHHTVYTHYFNWSWKHPYRVQKADKEIEAQRWENGDRRTSSRSWTLNVCSVVSNRSGCLPVQHSVPSLSFREVLLEYLRQWW